MGDQVVLEDNDSGGGGRGWVGEIVQSTAFNSPFNGLPTIEGDALAKRISSPEYTDSSPEAA